MKSRSLRPTITSKITRAQLERAVAALAEGDRPPFVALAMGVTTQQLWNLRTGRTLMLKDGPNPYALKRGSRRAA
jgi:hypothetical protein